MPKLELISEPLKSVLGVLERVENKPYGIHRIFSRLILLARSIRGVLKQILGGVRGVALVVENSGEEILILQEFHSKPHIGKLKGMYSIPMETCLQGETDSTALQRLHKEELPGLSLSESPPAYIGAYRVVSGVWVNLYATTTDSGGLPKVVGDTPEVGNYRWMPVKEALQLLLRRGALEMITDHAEDRQGVVRRRCRPPERAAG